MLKSVHLNRLGNSNTQVDIEDISNGILKLTANRYRKILSTSSINFELKSEEEQDALIDIYESFLNSIGFPIQFLIRTREIDMDGYINDLQDKITSETVVIYKKQLESYRQFIASLIASNKILRRQFYVIIPLDPLKNQEASLIYDQLNIRADIVTKNLARLGIACKSLSSIELVDLFYSFYAPEHAKLQPISETALEIMNREFIVKGNRLS